MSEVESRLSTAPRKSVAVMQRMFPKLSKRYCPDREGEFCRVTGKRCELESCPKMEELIREQL